MFGDGVVSVAKHLCGVTVMDPSDPSYCPRRPLDLKEV
jgi:hypothetical protein